MGTTAAGLPYPDPTDLLANVDLAIKALAQALIGDRTVVVPTAAANWTVGASAGRKLGTAFAWLELVATRATGAATITAGADGNVTDEALLTLPATWRPTVATQRLWGDRGGGVSWRAGLGTDGVLSLWSGEPTATIAAGQTLTFHGLVALT
jgi:hypothetical protein